MTLQEYLKLLSYGELSNLWGPSTIKGEFPTEKLPIIINGLNEGLLRLYTKFNLKENFVFVELNEITTLYLLTKDHIILEDEEPSYDRYIYSPEDHPFRDDVIKILSIRSSLGNKVKLNDGGRDCCSVFTPVYKGIQVSHPMEGIILAVNYQAKHPTLSVDIDLNKQYIELPETLYGALNNYVAYYIHSNMNTETAIANAQKYLTMFNSLVDEAISSDIVNSSYSQTNTKFFERGWC